MKKYFKNIFLFVLSIIFLISCKKLDDNYRQFIDEGETIYIGKADSVIVRGGNQRVEISWLLLSDPKVNSYKLYWNNYRDSTSALVTKTSNIDTVRVLLENMTEGLHHFEIVLYDKMGNHSVPTQTSGRSYGEQYSSFLVNRTFNSAKLINDGDLLLDWVAAEEQLLYSELLYLDTDGNSVKHIVDREAQLDTLKKFPLDGIFKLISAYKPDSIALDTFYSKTEDIRPL